MRRSRWFNAVVWVTMLAFLGAWGATENDAWAGGAALLFVQQQIWGVEERVDRLWERFNDERAKRIDERAKRIADKP